MKYAVLGLGLLLLVTVAFAKWQYNRAEQYLASFTQSEERRKTEAIQFEQAKAALERSVLLLEKQRERDQAQLGALSSENQKIAQERDDEKAKLDSYRDRISSAALAKPGLVGILASRATSRLFLDVQRASTNDQGRDTVRANPKVPPTTAKSDQPTGEDRDPSPDTERDPTVE